MALFVGIPLEMSQPGLTGSLRVAGLYMAGVLLGSVASSIIEPTQYLVGASAGVYALVTAHLATLVLNWHEDGMIYRTRLRSMRKGGTANCANSVAPMRLNPVIRCLRLMLVLAFVAIDVGL